MLEISIIFPVQLEKLKLRKEFPYTTMGGGQGGECVPRLIKLVSCHLMLISVNIFVDNIFKCNKCYEMIQTCQH